MSVRLRYRVVFEGEYDADPEGYGTDDPAAMAHIDAEMMDEDTLGFLGSSEGGDVNITVEPA